MSVMTLLIARRLDNMTLKGAFQPKQFNDSISMYVFYSLYECCNLQALNGSAFIALLNFWKSIWSKKDSWLWRVNGRKGFILLDLFLFRICLPSPTPQHFLWAGISSPLSGVKVLVSPSLHRAYSPSALYFSQSECMAEGYEFSQAVSIRETVTKFQRGGHSCRGNAAPSGRNLHYFIQLRQPSKPGSEEVLFLAGCGCSDLPDFLSTVHFTQFCRPYFSLTRIFSALGVLSQFLNINMDIPTA